jgi:hypothetical protein
VSRPIGLDCRTKTGCARKAALAAIVRELGGKVSPLQRILADAVAFDIARLAALNNRAADLSDPELKLIAESARGRG